MTSIKSPTHLFIGPEKAITKAAATFIISMLSDCNYCTNCFTCKAITERNHYALLWLCPEKTYTKEIIDPVFKKLTFIQAAQDPFFIVLEKADCLTVQCANSLLKSLEEPPAHYYFILLSTNENLLPTLTSRCVIHYSNSDQQDNISSIVSLFCTNSRDSITIFTKEVERAKINENSLSVIIEHVLHHWLASYKQSPTLQKERIIAYLSSLLSLPIAPGSTKLFLRSLYLTIAEYKE